MSKIILLLSAFVLSTSAIPLVLVQPAAHLAHPELAHQAVISSGQWEQSLPQELLKSARFYNDPKTAELLSQASWFTDKENPVFVRKADEIDRSQVFKIFRNAGLQKK